MSKVIKLPITTPPPNAEERARAETESKSALFAWADAVLVELDVGKAVRDATTLQEIRAVSFDPNAADVILAIRAALHPVIGQRQACFDGMTAGMLKQVLKSRFNDLIKAREAAVRGRRGRGDWTDELMLNELGEPLSNLANLILILREAPKWKGVLGVDEFAVRVVIRKRPPWGQEALDAPWTDHHDALARVWFQQHDYTPSMGDIGRAVQTAARTNGFHPVRDYLAALVWDGVARLDTWLIDYFHAEDTPYIRAIAPRYLISAVARIYQPGCQADHMLVLEGPQGKLKSTALRLLAVNEAWFTDRLSHVASKDAALEVTGVWVIEIAEMDALTRASPSAIKSFLTRRKDRFRPPYGKRLTDVPRQCVFAGSINPPVGGYLKDPTGARRFWPVACVGMIDVDGLQANRDQIWAEAVHRFTSGEKWWLPSELEALATAEQKARFAVDVWEEPIREWLGDRIEVTLVEVLRRALGITQEHHTQAVQKRVVGILTGMGFKWTRARTRNRRKQVYRRDPPNKTTTGQGRPTRKSRKKKLPRKKASC
jgi:predicted P-loop ATPase